jgi:AbiV family abortive infection protein
MSLFRESMYACLANGERLLEDVRWLLDLEQPQSALVLAVIAQEEFAKGFLLHLVDEGVVPWHPLVHRATRDHACKQLLAIVMDHMNPGFEDWQQRFAEAIATPKPFEGFPGPVASAINILRHDKIRRWEDSRWSWAEPPEYDRIATRTARGDVDAEKQDALYVRLTASGGVASMPTRVGLDQAKAAAERAGRLRAVLAQLAEKEVGGLWDYEQLQEAFQLLFKDLDPRARGESE